MVVLFGNYSSGSFLILTPFDVVGRELKLNIDSNLLEDGSDSLRTPSSGSYFNGLSVGCGNWNGKHRMRTLTRSGMCSTDMKCMYPYRALGIPEEPRYFANDRAKRLIGNLIFQMTLQPR